MKMKYKLLFVDDEDYVREQICSSINWEDLGVDLVGSCGNSIEALELMVDEMPDILVTDIKMPIMDGLELIEKAKKMNASLECVILSGYAEFSLAQSAIEHGVRQYLLKPFSKEEFEKVLRKCCKKIKNESKEKLLSIEERSRLISNLSQELQMMLANRDAISVDDIRETIAFYPDASMLREALILLITEESKRQHMDSVIKQIPKLFENTDNLDEQAVNLLHLFPNESKKDSWMVSRIKNYTKEHFGYENLNLQYIAAEIVHLGVKYVGRCFLKETGMKYSEFLLEIRMEKAKELLKFEDISNEEIAEIIGLGNNVPYFYQLFKKYTGITPGEFKKLKCKTLMNN